MVMRKLPMGARGNGSWLYSTTDLIENGASGFNASLTKLWPVWRIFARIL